MAQLKHILQVTFVSLFLYNIHGSGAIQGNDLGTLAASMKPGTWAVLNQDSDGSGYGKALTNSGSGGVTGGGALVFCGKATYDPARNRVFHLGSGHPFTSPIKFLNYEVQANRWTLLPTPQWAVDMQSNGHCYNLQTVSPGQYFRMYANGYDVRVADINKVNVGDIGNGAWSDYPDPTTAQAANRGVLEYFPDRNSLVLIDSGLGKVWEKPLTSPGWTERGTFFPDLATDGIAGIYNPVHKVLAFGGGASTSTWRKMDSSGVISRIDDSPIESYAISGTLFSVDPVSGKYILIRPNSSTSPTGWYFYELDIAKSVGTQWTRRNDLEQGTPQFTADFSLAAVVIVPIPTYGVNLVMAPAKTYLYKHATGPTNPPLPPPPASPAPDPSFGTKLQQPGVIAGYGFDSVSNVRNFPVASAYPMRYFWTSTGSPSCNTANLGTNYSYTPATRGSNDGNALAAEDGGVCRFPIIDNGALRIEVPGRSGSSAGGYFDTPFQGVDLPKTRISPDTGGEVWFQWKVKTKNMNYANFNGATAGSKVAILGAAPPWVIGSDRQVEAVITDDLGKNNIVSGYTHALPTGGGDLKNWDRLVGNTRYMQNAAQCPYSGAGTYPSPPCTRFKDDGTWQELTFRFKIRSVASDFTVSGNVLSSPGRFTPWWPGGLATIATETLWVYVEGDGYYVINQFIDNNSVRLATSPAAGSGKTVWISSYNNSIIQVFLDGALAINLENGEFFWDGANGVPAGFGSFRLIPHMTNKIDTIDHPTAYIWYDDLIISTKPILMISPTRVSAPAR